MVELDSESPFKRPGEVPFDWEIRPGIPKIRISQPDNGHSTLLQPPKKLSLLRITKLPPSPSSSSLAVSPFAPPQSSRPPPSSRTPPPPYWRCSSARATILNSGATTVLRRLSLFKSLLRFKNKCRSRDNVKNSGLDSTTSSESDIFYDAETTSFSSSESSLSSYCRMKRNESDLSSSEKRIILMMERDRLDWDVVV